MSTNLIGFVDWFKFCTDLRVANMFPFLLLLIECWHFPQQLYHYIGEYSYQIVNIMIKVLNIFNILTKVFPHSNYTKIIKNMYMNIKCHKSVFKFPLNTAPFVVLYTAQQQYEKWFSVLTQKLYTKHYMLLSTTYHDCW